MSLISRALTRASTLGTAVSVRLAAHSAGRQAQKLEQAKQDLAQMLPFKELLGRRREELTKFPEGNEWHTGVTLLTIPDAAAVDLSPLATAISHFPAELDAHLADHLRRVLEARPNDDLVLKECSIRTCVNEDPTGSLHSRTPKYLIQIIVSAKIDSDPSMDLWHGQSISRPEV